MFGAANSKIRYGEWKLMISPEQKEWIEKLSLIPFFVVFLVFIPILLYLGTKNVQFRSPLFYWTYLIILFVIAMPFTIFLTRAILISRVIRKPLSSFRRQLSRLALTCLLMGGMVGGFLAIFYIALSPWLTQEFIVILMAGACFATLFVLVIRYKSWFDRLTEDL